MASRTLDQYATRHCPVVVFEKGELIDHYDSISDCAKALNISVTKVKKLLYYQDLFQDRFEFDIPAESLFEAKLGTVVRAHGIKNVVRITQKGKVRKKQKRYEHVYIGGKMQIRPLSTNVLIHKEEEKKTESGLILIENNSYSGLLIGSVVACGTDVDVVKVGQKVLYQDSDATEVSANQEVLYIVGQQNIFAIVE